MIKKSRKQFVPDELKDDKYWARRRKNNIAAKRSRDARRQKENQIAMRARYLEKEVNWLSLSLQLFKPFNANTKLFLICDIFYNYDLQDFFAEFNTSPRIGATETRKHGTACPSIQISRCIRSCYFFVRHSTHPHTCVLGELKHRNILVEISITEKQKNKIRNSNHQNTPPFSNNICNPSPIHSASYQIRD